MENPPHNTFTTIGFYSYYNNSIYNNGYMATRIIKNLGTAATSKDHNNNNLRTKSTNLRTIYQQPKDYNHHLRNTTTRT